MIRKIQITNDLLDVIKSCPSGVIDDIYKIEYYIQGFDTVYEAKFTHEGDCLKVVLPSSELEKLENGILMRRAYYKVSDSSYPDGYYNLTFEDNMNVWLGGESSDPYERQYVTEKDLNKTLEDYALKTEIPDVSGYATQQWVESKGYVTAETLPEGIATESWVQSQGYLTQHQDLSSYALKSEIPDVSGYVQETNLKTINGESLVGKGDIVIQTTAENIECGPISSGLFNFSNVNDGLVQITGSVEEINNTKENKKPVFYIDVDFDGPVVLTSYNDYLTIGAQIKQLGVENVVLYVRDRSGYICIPDVIEAVSQNMMTITGMAYTNNYRIYNNSSSLFISFDSFVGYTQLNNNINGVKTWVVNQNYAKKTELKTINGQSIVGSGDITIQATGGVTEEWLQNNLKTINGESLIGVGNLAVQSPIEISIDLDSGQLSITYDDYKAMIDEYFADGGYTKKLMIFLGSETAGRGYSSYPSDVEYYPDGKIEIGGYYLDDRDENNKKLVYYRIKGNDATKTVDISLTPVSSGGVTEEWVTSQGYATETWVTSQGYLTEHQDLTGYALKSEIPDVSGYALKSEVPSLTGYATETWVESKGYLTEHQSLVDYALKSEIPSLDGYATQNWVSSQGYLTSHQDLTGYATETWVESKGYITSIPDTFATKTWVTEQGYLTSHQDLSSYALKSEIPSLTGYATQSWVTSQGYLTEHQDLSSYALKSDIPSLTGYATQSWVSSQGYLTSHQDLTGYATQSWVSSQGYTTQTYVDNKIGQIDTLLDQMLG